MRIVLQRVKEASVIVEGKKVANIGKGFLLLVGVAKGDEEKSVRNLAAKISKLRVFEDENGKMNLSIKDIEGEVLSVPQFTLLGSTNKGNRPGFDMAALPDKAESMWKLFNNVMRADGTKVSEGVFAAHMDVALVNDGPVTLILDSK